MAKFNISASVVLDKPLLTHYGPSSLITGGVLIKYNRHESKGGPAELFGPLRIVAHFRGRFFVRTEDNDHNSKQIEQQLFHLTSVLCDGPFRVAPGGSTFSFFFRFPDRSDIEGRALPASLIFHSSLKVECEYRISAEVSMPGLHTKIHGMEPVAVKYMSARIPAAAALRNEAALTTPITITSVLLLPAHQRPTGVRGKTVHFFKHSDPSLCIDITTSTPRNLYLEQPITVSIQAVPRAEKSPALSVFDFKAKLIALTRCEGGGLDAVSKKQEVLAITANPRRLTEERATNMKTELIQGIVPTFHEKHAERTYSLRYSFKLRCVDREVKVAREYPVVVLPPVEGYVRVYENEDEDPPPYA